VIIIAKKRFTVTMCLCIIAMLFSVVPVQAAGAGSQPLNGPMLRWINIIMINMHPAIDNGGRATMSGTVVANPGTESITVNVLLERVNPNGTRTHVWSQNGLRTNGNTWAWERPIMVARGHDYRLTFTVTAVRNGISETASLSRVTRAN